MRYPDHRQWIFVPHVHYKILSKCVISRIMMLPLYFSPKYENTRHTFKKFDILIATNVKGSLINLKFFFNALFVSGKEICAMVG